MSYLDVCSTDEFNVMLVFVLVLLLIQSYNIAQDVQFYTILILITMITAFWMFAWCYCHPWLTMP